MDYPPEFSLEGFERVASIRSTNPVDFARLNRHFAPSSPSFFKTFGRGERTACLIQRNSPILMVAHVDTVLTPEKKARVVGSKIYHRAVDNRLGTYLGLEVLPAMGIDVDLLLTTGEEAGASTAGIFTTRKQYRWIFSFDRRGDDVVCYQYECLALIKILEAAGFALGTGSYSCISELESLGCCGLNFGCGMADYHGDQSHFDLDVLAKQISRFAEFYRRYSSLHFPHDTPEGRQNLHPWAVSIESLFWQLEYHIDQAADDAAENCIADLNRLFACAPELKADFAGELTRFSRVCV